jgi:K+-sensing histidine kinase KdpD
MGAVVSAADLSPRGSFADAFAAKTDRALTLGHARGLYAAVRMLNELSEDHPRGSDARMALLEAAARICTKALAIGFEAQS